MRLSRLAAGSSIALLSLAPIACTNDDNGDIDAYCEAMQGVLDADSTEEVFDNLRDAADAAPSEIREDIENVVELEDLYFELEENPDDEQLLEEVEQLEQEIEESTENVEEFTKDECDIDLNGDSSSDGSDEVSED